MNYKKHPEFDFWNIVIHHAFSEKPALYPAGATPYETKPGANDISPPVFRYCDEDSNLKQRGGDHIFARDCLAIKMPGGAPVFEDLRRNGKSPTVLLTRGLMGIFQADGKKIKLADNNIEHPVALYDKMDDVIHDRPAREHWLVMDKEAYRTLGKFALEVLADPKKGAAILSMGETAYKNSMSDVGSAVNRAIRNIVVKANLPASSLQELIKYATDHGNEYYEFAAAMKRVELWRNNSHVQRSQASREEKPRQWGEGV